MQQNTSFHFIASSSFMAFILIHNMSTVFSSMVLWNPIDTTFTASITLKARKTLTVVVSVHTARHNVPRLQVVTTFTGSLASQTVYSVKIFSPSD